MSLRAAAGRRKKKKKTTDRQWQNRIKEPSVVGKKKKDFQKTSSNRQHVGAESGNQGPGVRRGAGSGDWLMEGRSEGIWWTGGE